MQFFCTKRYQKELGLHSISLYADAEYIFLKKIAEF